MIFTVPEHLVVGKCLLSYSLDGPGRVGKGKKILFGDIADMGQWWELSAAVTCVFYL